MGMGMGMGMGRSRTHGLAFNPNTNERDLLAIGGGRSQTVILARAIQVVQSRTAME
jgi:hypothetical protein